MNKWPDLKEVKKQVKDEGSVKLLFNEDFPGEAGKDSKKIRRTIKREKLQFVVPWQMDYD
jgi:hypothetical protein